MNIPELIKNRRQELGLTLEQVGEACGVGKSTVRKWETGYIKNMKIDKIKQLASVLHLDPVDLVDKPSDITTLPSGLIPIFRIASGNFSREMCRPSTGVLHGQKSDVSGTCCSWA